MSTSSQEGHVLYVEDHDDTRILMTMMLERAGFKVNAVGNAAECLKLAGSGHH
nr:DNA-binding response regulator [Acidobacteriota bacterium]